MPRLACLGWMLVGSSRVGPDRSALCLGPRTQLQQTGLDEGKGRKPRVQTRCPKVWRLEPGLSGSRSRQRAGDTGPFDRAQVERENVFRLARRIPAFWTGARCLSWASRFGPPFSFFFFFSPGLFRPETCANVIGTLVTGLASLGSTSCGLQRGHRYRQPGWPALELLLPACKAPSVQLERWTTPEGPRRHARTVKRVLS